MPVFPKEVSDLIRSRDCRAQAVDLPQQFEHDGARVIVPDLGEALGGEWWAMAHV